MFALNIKTGYEIHQLQSCKYKKNFNFSVFLRKTNNNFLILSVVFTQIFQMV